MSEELTQRIEKRDFVYHSPSNEQIEDYKTIRYKAQVFAHLINELCPDSREKSLALTNLEQAVMWANAAIARSDK